MTYRTQDIGEIKAGETVNIAVRAAIFGQENDQPEIKMTLRYHLAGSNTLFEKEINPIDYEENKEQYESDVKKGKYAIKHKYYEETYEMVRIGRLIDTNLRKVPYQGRSMAEKGKAHITRFVSFINYSIDGMRIPLAETIEKLDEVYNMVQMIIMKERAKFIGKVITYDRAYLPQKTTIKIILWQSFNEGVIDYASNASLS